jgi:FkbM family methyltransferase
MNLHELKGPKGKLKAKVVLKPPIERLQHCWERGQFYEREVLQYIYERYQGGTFVDAGSNIGNHTLWFAMYCADLVVSIEPVKAMLEWQLENLALNGLDNVRTFNMALSDELGWGEMVKAPENPQAKWPWNLGMWNLQEGRGLTCVVALDNLLSNYNIKAVSLVKMDIEGFELKALMGARRLLEREHPALFLEAYPEARMREFADFLGPLGYQGKLIYKNMAEFTWQR